MRSRPTTPLVINEKPKGRFICTCNDTRNKKNMSSRGIISQIMLWHQSLKSIGYIIEHYKFSRTKKTTDMRLKTWGDKRHVIPPMSKHGGDILPPYPPGFTPLLVIFISLYTGVYAEFLRGGPNFKISWILDIHAAKLRAFARGVWGYAPQENY